MVEPADDAASDGAADKEVALALRDLAQAVRTLQLYPSDSPVVGHAVERAHRRLAPFLGHGRMTLAVLPDTIRVGNTNAGEGNANVRSLAERLHQRGVAHLHLDGALNAASLRRLSEMLATDADELNQQGGIRALCERHVLDGIDVEMLQFDKLFAAEGSPTPSSSGAAVWEKILDGFRGGPGKAGAARDASIDDATLAADPEKLNEFMSWLIETQSATDGIADMSRLQVVRAVCERVGEAAHAAGPDRIETVADVFRQFYDKLDKEVWLELLSEGLTTVHDAPAPEDSAAAYVGPGNHAAEDPDAGAGDRAVAELARGIGAQLDRRQVEELLTYALGSRRDGSPRIFGLFRSLLEGRSERGQMEQSIRDAVRRQTQSETERQSFEDLWPRITAAVEGEQLEAYVSTTYRAQMEWLLRDAPLATLWDADRITPRMRELEPGYLVQRKVKILLEILAAETNDADYRTLLEELDRQLPELFVDGQYIAAEEVLQVITADLSPDSGRPESQREAARELLLRFCNEHTLREVVRNLGGRESTQIDAATRIFSSLGAMAVPALLEALSNEQSRAVRVHLVRMLAAIGDLALPEIRKHLRDKRWFFVRNLAWLIGEIADPRFIPYLAVIVNHPDVRVRRETVRSMAKLRNEAATEVLLSALDDPETDVRLLAIRGLGTTRATGAVAQLRELVRLSNRSGRNTEVIRAAAIALGRIGAAEALPDLINAAHRPWFLRRRRIAAYEAARWAIATLQGEVTGEAPEARLRMRDEDYYVPPAAED
jgi:HEAT repeat protein